VQNIFSRKVISTYFSYIVTFSWNSPTNLISRIFFLNYVSFTWWNNTFTIMKNHTLYNVRFMQTILNLDIIKSLWDVLIVLLVIYIMCFAMQFDPIVSINNLFIHILIYGIFKSIFKDHFSNNLDFLFYSMSVLWRCKLIFSNENQT